MNHGELIPHLFRTEHSKLIAVLCHAYSLTHIELAEDIVSETFLSAAETWGTKGIPDNPTAWLYAVAKNNAKHYFRRQGIFQDKIKPIISAENAKYEELDIDFSEQNIQDSQLKMIFAICDPNLSNEAQISLALRVLCGFGIEEISKAFMTNKETTNKRLHRGKTKLKANVSLALPNEHELKTRINNVLKTLYLLFNEGYYSNSTDKTLRLDLCFEALRLSILLTQNTTTSLPQVHALIALMCFHASRFQARTDDQNHWILYDDQDDSLWDYELIKQGEVHMNLGATGNEVSSYHLEAAIAYWHTRKKDPKKWKHILNLYNQLLTIKYTQATAINRTYALARVQGWSAGLKEALRLRLEEVYSYQILLGELYSQSGDFKNSSNHLQAALDLASNLMEKEVIQKKLLVLQSLMARD